MGGTCLARLRMTMTGTKAWNRLETGEAGYCFRLGHRKCPDPRHVVGVSVRSVWDRRWVTAAPVPPSRVGGIALDMPFICLRRLPLLSRPCTVRYRSHPTMTRDAVEKTRLKHGLSLIH